MHTHTHTQSYCDWNRETSEEFGARKIFQMQVKGARQCLKVTVKNIFISLIISDFENL